MKAVVHQANGEHYFMCLLHPRDGIGLDVVIEVEGDGVDECTRLAETQARSQGIFFVASIDRLSREALDRIAPPDVPVLVMKGSQFTEAPIE